MFNIKKDIPFTPRERQILGKLSTPGKIQDYLDALPINFEPEGDTVLSPRRVMREGRAHCIEGAFLAALALGYHGKPALVMDLVSSRSDLDHVVALFCRKGHWGALSKTNHAVLRYREPVYRSVRELAMSYFHEYFLDDGRKTLRQYSQPFDLFSIKNKSWITSEKNLWHIVDAINSHPHTDILTRSQIALLRLAHKLERQAGKLVEWRKSGKKQKHNL